MKKRKLLVIGWDACEWKVVNELIAKGLMPTLEAFLKEGTSGKIATLDPPVSPMLWTSIATGKRPDEHGVLGFTEPDPNPDSKFGIRPVNVTSRKVKAIWNILNQSGYKSNLVGWWPSHPAEKINGCVVTNRFQLFGSKPYSEFPMVEDTIYPERLKEIMADLRVHPSELTRAHIFPFVQDYEKVNQEKDKSLFHVVKTLAETSSIHNAATYLMENEPYDFMGVYYDGMDHFSHIAMKYRSPKPDGVPQDKFEIYNGVVDAAYRFHDMMLERILKLTDENTTVMIVSDHGFHPDHLRPIFIPQEPSGPTYEHSPYGFFAIKGPGIKKDEKIFGASIIDITPTILALYDLPVGKDMKGRPLVQIFDEKVAIKFIDSWENVEGDHGMHGKDDIRNLWAEQEAMDQLVELGYVDAPDADKAKNIKMTVDESNYLLARNYIDQEMWDKAAPLLKELSEENDYEERFSLRLFNCYIKMGKVDECNRILGLLKERHKDSLPDSISLCEGLYYTTLNRPNEAMTAFQRILNSDTKNQIAYTHVGQVFLMKRDFVNARKYFEKALHFDNGNPYTLLGLGYTYFASGEYETALEFFLEIIDNIYFFPKAHFRIGQTFFKMGMFQQAVQALTIAASQAPRDINVHKFLIRLYSPEYINDPEKMKIHEFIIREKIKGRIIVVTGPPRSGTSAVMQMMEKSGIPVLYDNTRPADEYNPNGYYEFEPARKLSFDKKWMDAAIGKVVKIPYDLIHLLPKTFDYKILYLQRNSTEMISSMAQLMPFYRKHQNAYPFELAASFKEEEIKIANYLRNLNPEDVLEINFDELLSDSHLQAQRIANFLEEEELPENEMASAIDTSLPRFHSSSKSKSIQQK